MIYQNLVIGSCLESLYFAIKNDYPIIVRSLSCPPRIFPKVHELWKGIAFLLALDGKLPVSHRVESVEVSGNSVKVFDNSGLLSTLSFKNLHIFDNNFVKMGDLHEESRCNDYLVLDWFLVSNCRYHNIKEINTEDSFAGKLVFYSGDRHYTSKKHKDLCVMSRLSYENLKDSDYCEIYSRFRALSIMADNGIKGKINSKNKRTGKIYFVKPALTFSNRDVIMSEPHRYPKTDHICFYDFLPLDELEKTDLKEIDIERKSRREQIFRDRNSK
tara:strand:- start:4433 stop:5248 length:816 start_codon:yes stop_codon:yes gene_type:complete